MIVWTIRVAIAVSIVHVILVTLDRQVSVAAGRGSAVADQPEVLQEGSGRDS